MSDDRPPQAGTELQVIEDASAAQKALDIMSKGDLSKLGQAERATFLANMAQSLGLNPLTRPVDLIANDKGNLIIYWNRGATDQLRAKHNVNLQVLEKYNPTPNTYAVLVRATLPNGRQDESTGVVVMSPSMSPADQANSVMKAECVPLSYEILTKEGFKSPLELSGDEIVAAMDPATRVSTWTPLQGFKIYEDQELYHYGNAYIEFETTEGHKWVTDQGLRALEEFNNGYVHLAGVLPGADVSALTEKEAAVLGWLVTDGHIDRYKGKLYRGFICQSKERNFESITWACTGLVGPVTRGLTDNRGRGWLDQHFWYLSKVQTQGLLEKAGITTWGDLPDVPLRLDYMARASMLDAMMRADGDARGGFCKTKPHVMETFRLLSTLQGILLSREHAYPPESRPLATKTIYKQRQLDWTRVARQNLPVMDKSVGTVWCPTTALGTWYCKTNNNQVLVTGNTKAKRRATLSILGLGLLDESEMDTIPLFQQQLNQPRTLSAPAQTVTVIQPKPVVQEAVILPPEGSQEPESGLVEQVEKTEPKVSPSGVYVATTPKPQAQAQAVAKPSAHVMPGRRLPVAPPVVIK